MHGWALRLVFDLELLDRRSGYICFKASGKDVYEYFKNEAGGHRWQRIPPTERRDRVHTSTITVAVLEEVNPKDIQILEKDLDWKFSRGTGPGGQHKNKTDTCVNLTHIPSGTKVRVDGRSQHTNKENALFILKAKLKEATRNQFFQDRDKSRKEQVGSGMRGDKVRTIRVRDDLVTDHRMNRTTTYAQYAKGDLSDLR